MDEFKHKTPGRDYTVSFEWKGVMGNDLCDTVTVWSTDERSAVGTAFLDFFGGDRPPIVRALVDGTWYRITTSVAGSFVNPEREEDRL